MVVAFAKLLVTVLLLPFPVVVVVRCFTPSSFCCALLLVLLVTVVAVDAAANGLAVTGGTGTASDVSALLPGTSDDGDEAVSLDEAI